MRQIKNTPLDKLEDDNASHPQNQENQIIYISNRRNSGSIMKWFLGGLAFVIVVLITSKFSGFANSKSDNVNDDSSFSGLVGDSDAIHGVFGFELGDFVPEKSEKYKSSAREVHSGLIKYDIVPDMELAGFKKYMIYISPKSRRVVMISATAEEIQDGRNAQLKILDKLQKYGVAKEVVIGPDDFHDSRLYIIEQRDRFISVYLDNASSSPDIHINYVDRREREKSDKEIEAIKKKQEGFDRL